jgi:GDPmannose 4,6-dehydratase
MKKKALILGITGQDGSFISELLLKKNYIVHGYVRKSATGNLKNIEHLIEKNKLNIHHGDLLDFVSLTNVIKKVKPDEIYNFADQDHVRWSTNMPIYSFEVTGSSTLKILEIIKKESKNSKYFHPFSSNIFGNSKKPINEHE